MAALSSVLRAGPPFFTDDPVPVSLRNWEFYIASQHFIARSIVSGTLPQIEVNYGAITNVQLHLIMPMAFAKPKGLPFQYGPGDIEFGVKVRFVGETRSRPQIGTFPHIDLPAGSPARGLGADMFKFSCRSGSKKAGGRGRLTAEAATGSIRVRETRTIAVLDWEVQRDLSKWMTVGAEIISNSPKALGETGETGFNLGALLSVGKGQTLMVSAGRDFHGPNHFYTYVAYYWTWGPRG